MDGIKGWNCVAGIDSAPANALPRLHWPAGCDSRAAAVETGKSKCSELPETGLL